MILCYGFMDLASTIIVYHQLGTFEYERSYMLSWLFATGGIPAVITLKMMLTTIAALLLYYLAKLLTKFDMMCELLCVGASIVGVLASISNMNGALTLSTLYICGIGMDVIGYIIFMVFFLAGLISVIYNYSNIRLEL